MTVRDVDRGAAQLLRRMHESRAFQIRVGVLGSGATANKKTKDSSGNSKTLALTVADIAAIHEFGAWISVGRSGAQIERIPQRSWLRDWVDENRSKINGWIRITCKKIIQENVVPIQQWDRLGLKLQSSIQERIERGIPPELSEATVKARGDGIPLIHTGQFKNSITYFVDRLRNL